MDRDFRHGILTAGIYYGLGTLVSYITYWLFGGGGAHVPGLYIFVVLLMLLFGSIWLLRNLFEIIIDPKNKFHQGNLLIHAFIILVVIAFLGYEYYSY